MNCTCLDAEVVARCAECSGSFCVDHDADDLNYCAQNWRDVCVRCQAGHVEECLPCRRRGAE